MPWLMTKLKVYLKVKATFQIPYHVPITKKIHLLFEAYVSPLHLTIAKVIDTSAVQMVLPNNPMKKRAEITIQDGLPSRSLLRDVDSPSKN